MKMQLTKEQSQHLIDLGVPKEKASAYTYEESHKYKGGIELPPVQVPIFTLTDLLGILPKEIEITEGCKDTLVIDFIGGSVFAQYTFQTRTRQEEDELIDALYELCVWCLEKEYLNPKKM